MLPEWTVVGFSGHRKLANPKIAADAIRKIFDRLAADHSPLASVSSAASGSDTLFVEEVARRNLPLLIVLPFPKTRFQQDFNPTDWLRILPLIEKATRVEEITGEESTEEAYMETGIRTVDRADVMVVVWNCKPAAGLGGTGDVVAYIRELQKPLIIIDPESGEIVEERLEQMPAKSPSTDWNENPRKAVEDHFQELDKTAQVHAPKSRHLVLRIILFQLIASAIGFFALAFEIHSAPGQLLTLIELILLGSAFILSLQHRKKHQEWMKSRITAEICRSFLATWHMRRTDYSPKISIEGFDQFCRKLRLVRILDKTPPPSLEEVRGRYLKERVEDQIAYFSSYSSKARLIYKKLKVFAFTSTAVATFLALVALIFSFLNITGLLLTVPKYLSLMLPLASTATFLLMITQDYTRRVVRYSEMASLLEDAARRLNMVKTWNSLARIATETEEALLQEIVEWHSFRQFVGEPH